MFDLHLSGGLLYPHLQALNALALSGIVVALVLGGIVKGVTGIGVPLVAMPILVHFMPVKAAVLLLSMPIILGNIPQAIEGGAILATARRIAAPLAGTVIGNVIGVSVLIALEPHRAQFASGAVLIVAAVLLLASPRLKLAPSLVMPVGFAFGFGAALMESIASVPGPLLAMYLLATGATGRQFTKQIAIILVVSIVTLVTTFTSGAHANAADLAISAAASLPAIAGMLLARPLRDSLHPLAFRAVVLVCVLAAATQMIWKSGLL
ncbi:sulfite exporter TauE/SafE family protein [Paraburkholderia sp.]|uniref:sulfite exporter TauE/SafE family protein n=1 Tax=Paraburkholderia sp. TaxID=1926495 RepID=UPI0025F62AF1|nr:sulfite exporter TauE/SafE family protein [Paraburkholderia sp.]